MHSFLLAGEPVQTKKRESDMLLILGVVLITFAGGFVRIQPATTSTFPLNDGGLFYTMTMDLKSNGFALPLTTTYNLADIPFAYPPFAFYLTGLLSVLTDWQVLDIVRILPAVVSTLTIPAFFLLAKQVTRDSFVSIIAVLAFAFIPRTFDWLIMGGGITRSFGLLFATLVFWQASRFIEGPQVKNLLFFILLSAIVVYSHPEATVHVAIGTVIFYLMFDRSKKGLAAFALAAVVIAVLAAPWWIPVLQRHGIDPFLAASEAARADSYNPLVGVIVFFRYYFTDEPFTAIFATLGLVGMFRLLAQKKFFLPVWFFGAHLVEPRGGTLYMMLPLSIAVGIGLVEVLLPAFTASRREGLVRPGKVAYAFLGLLFFYGLFSANFASSKIASETSLKADDLAAFDWIGENTPSGSAFVIVTGENALRDPTSEWFPSITLRRSQATIFGHEWVRDGKFADRKRQYDVLQTCAFQRVECLETWQGDSGLPFDYVYIRKVQENKTVQTTLGVLLRQSENYTIVYESKQVDIFKSLAGQ